MFANAAFITVPPLVSESLFSDGLGICNLRLVSETGLEATIAVGKWWWETVSIWRCLIDPFEIPMLADGSKG